MSEDCLNLNIYIPNKAPPAGGFPVIVFFYGGSFTYGGASFPLYDGVTDVTLLEDAIYIAVNYRLSVFGFLAGDELKVRGVGASGPRASARSPSSAASLLRCSATA
jgi:para-nitrobenzyl esterase